MSDMSLMKRMLIESGFFDRANKDRADTSEGVGVLVFSDGLVLTGTRVKEGTICGPGGHIEKGETPEKAAIRETREEFGITPTELIPIAVLTGLPESYCDAHIFLCTQYEGKPICDGHEMSSAEFRGVDKLLDPNGADSSHLYLPFARSLEVMLTAMNDGGTKKKLLDTSGQNGRMKSESSSDGGPGSGNFGHKGRPGKLGGSGGGGSGSGGGGGKSEENTGGKSSFGGASSGEFSKAVAAAKKKVASEKAWRVTAHTQEELDSEYPGAKLHVTKGGSTVAVTKDGDIISVCGSSDDTLRGKDLMEMAVKNGGKKLDSYDGNHGFYVNCGFEPVSWCQWDEQYAPEGWTKGRDNPESVVFYKYTGKKQHMTKTEAAKHLADFKASVPASSDYDSAQSARDNSI